MVAFRWEPIKEEIGEPFWLFRLFLEWNGHCSTKEQRATVLNRLSLSFFLNEVIYATASATA